MSRRYAWLSRSWPHLGPGCTGDHCGWAQAGEQHLFERPGDSDHETPVPRPDTGRSRLAHECRQDKKAEADNDECDAAVTKAGRFDVSTRRFRGIIDDHHGLPDRVGRDEPALRD